MFRFKRNEHIQLKLKFNKKRRDIGTIHCTGDLSFLATLSYLMAQILRLPLNFDWLVPNK